MQKAALTDEEITSICRKIAATMHRAPWALPQETTDGMSDLQETLHPAADRTIPLGL